MGYLRENKVAKQLKRIKCPRCGSEKTSKILYGMPAMSSEMAEDIKNQRIYLGGCCVSDNDPKYHCFKCKHDFGGPALFPIDFNAMEPLHLYINEISLEVGGYLGGNKHYLLRHYGQVYTVTVESSGNGRRTSTYGYHLLAEEWERIVKHLYEECYLEDWEREYNDPYVLDGEQWSLDIKFVDNIKDHYYGSNKYPVYWEPFLKLFKSLEKNRDVDNHENNVDKDA